MPRPQRVERRLRPLTNVETFSQSQHTYWEADLNTIDPALPGREVPVLRFPTNIYCHSVISITV